MKIDWKNGAGVAFVIAAMLLFCIGIGASFDLNKSEWASWVQAIGSIGAIVGAVFIAQTQFGEAKKIADTQIEAANRQEVRSRLEIDRRRIETIKFLFKRIGLPKGAIENKLQVDRSSAVQMMSTVHFSDCKIALESLPLFDVPDAELVLQITILPRWLQLVIDAITAAQAERKTMFDVLQGPEVEALAISRFREVINEAQIAINLCDILLITKFQIDDVIS